MDRIKTFVFKLKTDLLNQTTESISNFSNKVKIFYNKSQKKTSPAAAACPKNPTAGSLVTSESQVGLIGPAGKMNDTYNEQRLQKLGVFPLKVDFFTQNYDS